MVDKVLLGCVGLITASALCASFIVYSISGFIVPHGVALKHELTALWEKQWYSYAPLPTSVLLVVLARILIYVFNAPDAKGSGLPAIRCILSGTALKGKLDCKIAIVKTACLSLALMAELPLGTEGPFAHIAACTARFIVVTWSGSAAFWRQHKYIRETILMTMVVVGSAACLGSPIGGALLGIELILPHPIDHFKWFLCFVAASVGSLSRYCLNMVINQTKFDTLLTTDIDSNKDMFTENWRNYGKLILCCIPLGILCGLLGALFVTLQDLAGKLYRFVQQKAGSKPNGCQELLIDLVIITCVISLNSALSYWEDLNAKGCAAILKVFFQKHWKEHDEQFMHLQVFEGLQVFLMARMVCTAFVIRLPVPTGAVAPCLVLGAVLGRLYAHAITLNHHFGETGQLYFAWFAILGSAAFTGAVWRTFAIVVTLFELLAVKELIVPLAGTTLLAMMVAKYCTVSILDSIMIFKKLPGVPLQRYSNFSRCVAPAEECMTESYSGYVLPRTCSENVLLEKMKQLNAMARKPSVIGIVESVPVGDKSTELLVGGIREAALEEFAKNSFKTSFWQQHPEPIDLLATALQEGAYTQPAITAHDEPLMQVHARMTRLEEIDDFAFVTNDGICQGVITLEMLERPLLR